MATSTDDRALDLHRRLRGKVGVDAKADLTADTLELLYTPGVGAASRAIADDPDAAVELTGRGNAVAVVSDGSAVLGLGDEGPLAALPVLEGKALLFKALAGVDAVPIALDVHDEDAFVAAVTALAPTFGAINLEDVAAPACFEVERRLREALDVPVVHDDQHGTAIVALAGLINAFRVAGRALEDARVVVVGAGAGGNAVARLLDAHGVGALAVTDSHGALGPHRDDLDDVKRDLVDDLGLEDEGEVGDVLRGADAVVGLATPGAFDLEHVRTMADDPVVFALANPDPEVDPEEARDAGAAVVATGRSDFPNQVNNVLAFPGLFRGALAGGLRDVDDDACLRAARALADLVDAPTAERILPDVLDEAVVPAVARAVAGD
ncbi:NAD(P)-dependent malic enzyme [Patulibacter sp. S7RM1-6]